MSLGTWIRARRKLRTDFVRCEGLGGTEPISQMSKMMIERLHRDAVSKTPTAIYYHQHETEKKKNRRLTTLFKTTTLNWASNTNYTLLFAMSIMKNYLSERQNHSFMSHKKALFQTLQRTKKNNLVTRVHSYPSLRSEERSRRARERTWERGFFFCLPVCYDQREKTPYVFCRPNGKAKFPDRIEEAIYLIRIMLKIWLSYWLSTSLRKR